MKSSRPGTTIAFTRINFRNGFCTVAKRKLLVVVEIEGDPHRTVDRGIQVAKLLNCDLDILVCTRSFGSLFGGILVSNEAEEIHQGILQSLDEMADELAEPARNAGLTVATTIMSERPVYDGILAKALDTDPCIVMKETQFHSKAERSILVDADWQLMRSCPYPLWLVKRERIGENLVVVAAVDPTHTHDKPAALDQIIVDSAKAIAEPTDGQVHLLHTYERIAGIGAAANRALKPTKLPIDEIDQRIKNSHRLALDKLASRNDIDADHTHQLPGRTRDILPTFVRSENADLVVMGALARWGMKRMVIGSTAERVLDHLPCDVLIVRDNEQRICK